MSLGKGERGREDDYKSEKVRMGRVKKCAKSGE